MKADELQIGDIVRVAKDVCIPKGTIVSIRGIDVDNRFKDQVRRKCLVGSATCLPLNSEDGFTGGVWVEYLEPISITPEILEKNGFKRSNQYNYIYKDDYCKVRVSVVPKIKIDNIDLGGPAANVSIEGALFDINMMMTAIHELQQAFRLCGIEKEIIL